VVLADWSEKELQAAAKGLADKGHKTLAVGCDVSDDAQVEAMVKQTVATFGRLDEPTTMPAFKVCSPRWLTLLAMTTTGSWRSTCVVSGAV
jgi:NAD(P)-dependent dehydrogenase (short-subunit alcohol dehydrogenase family)